MPLALLVLTALALGLYLHIGRSSERDLEQASLLPFADDPEAAGRMSAATGLQCERLVNPLDDSIPEPSLLA
ncbi:hypothetical protein ACOXVJ_09875 [Pseudomonas knackmussii]|uniref:Cytochrome c oxidase cbb3-type subunit 4 n=1 Tax=Pseudomonas panipatensis TaxID=428992 RepID=A0A1G8KQ27_9PSED|nr:MULTISPECIES: hypothetical protein [Pseudomonas]SDI45528.1 hypothetical protein SAMN05216272_109185 [Pseudomonas panipatensis]SMP70359.1 hypothetical protein SAMN06295951_109185 [Pseudomonas panipatensis]